MRTVRILLAIIRFSDIASHKSRAALFKKVKVIKKLASEHGYSSFVIYCYELYTRQVGLSIVFSIFLSLIVTKMLFLRDFQDPSKKACLTQRR